MSSRKDPQTSRNIREVVEKISRDISHASKDLASASRTWAKSTTKFVEDVSPKVSATLDDGIEKASNTFTHTMRNIDTQTKPQQVRLLRAYRLFLSKQVDLIEKRLKKLKA